MSTQGKRNGRSNYIVKAKVFEGSDLRLRADAVRRHILTHPLLLVIGAVGAALTASTMRYVNAGTGLTIAATLLVGAIPVTVWGIGQVQLRKERAQLINRVQEWESHTPLLPLLAEAYKDPSESVPLNIQRLVLDLRVEKNITWQQAHDYVVMLEKALTEVREDAIRKTFSEAVGPAQRRLTYLPIANTNGDAA